MEPTVAAIFAAAAANAIVVLGGFALWLGHRTRRAERLEQRERERAQQFLAPVEARLAEITRALDVVAVEVERVAEAQRYLATREQPPTPPLPPRRLGPSGPGGRIVTPH